MATNSVQVSSSKPASKNSDFGKLKLKVGIEMHQQLSSGTKLFCPCPTQSPITDGNEKKKETPDQFSIQFTRKLRAVASELGEVDVAARFEARNDIVVRYYANPETSCLVEADEEPPHPVNLAAFETALIFALVLHAGIIDEVHVMRKIVVDGSNTSGFQRTALVAIGGELRFNGRRSNVGVQSICVEEDAARTLDFKAASKSYSLDRLGTPLVEVALAPITTGEPKDVEAAALELGRLLRSTGRIARGLGSIRQDLNVSILEGNVVEVKGVQRLELIPKVVEYEALRQKLLVDIAAEIRSRIGEALEIAKYDVTEQFKNSSSKIIRSALSASPPGIVHCILIKHFRGIFGRQNAIGARLGKELGEIAKVHGLGGVFHSDELPNYGITVQEVENVRKFVNASDEDGFVLLTGSPERVQACSEALVERLREVPRGVPPQTRAATEDGETRYLRPRPGAARMYPETDIPLVIVDPEQLKSLKAEIPDPWDVQITNYAKRFDLPLQLASPIFDSPLKGTFERILAVTKLSPRLVASTLVDTVQMLEREGVQVDRIKNEKIVELFQLLDKGRFAKEATAELIRYLSEHSEASAETAVKSLGLTTISSAELEKIVTRVITENMPLIETKGQLSKAALMGIIMGQVRGRADGKLVNETLSKILSKTLNGEEGFNQKARASSGVEDNVS